MAEFNFPAANNDMSMEELVILYNKMQKTMSWLMNNVDSKNVTELNTNVTNISSEDGSTIIDGNRLVMTDGSINRLKMGYNTTSGLFEFVIYNDVGGVSFEVDSNGDAVLKGSIDVTTDANIGDNLNLGDQTAVNGSHQVNFSNDAVIGTDVGDLIIFSGNALKDLILSSAQKLIMSAYSNNIEMYADDIALIATDDIILNATDKINLSCTRFGVFGVTPVVRPVVATTATLVFVINQLKSLGIFQ